MSNTMSCRKPWGPWAQSFRLAATNSPGRPLPCSAMTAPLNSPRTPPYKLAGLALTVILIIGLVLVFHQFRGDFTPKTRLTMIAPRAGLVMDPGSKVTYNGMEIGRVAAVDQIDNDGTPQAKLSLDVNPRYITSIPENVAAHVTATTVFGNKYVSLISPENPVPQRI